jgi:hypothetical protein
VIWVVEESFGMTLAGGATDPDSRPLLALLALAYWAPRALARTYKELSPKRPSHDVSCLATRHSCGPHAGRRGSERDPPRYRPVASQPAFGG